MTKKQCDEQATSRYAAAPPMWEKEMVQVNRPSTRLTTFPPHTTSNLRPDNESLRNKIRSFEVPSDDIRYAKIAKSCHFALGTSVKQTHSLSWSWTLLLDNSKQKQPQRQRQLHTKRYQIQSACRYIKWQFRHFCTLILFSKSGVAIQDRSKVRYIKWH